MKRLIGIVATSLLLVVCCGALADAALPNPVYKQTQITAAYRGGDDVSVSVSAVTKLGTDDLNVGLMLSLSPATLDGFKDNNLLSVDYLRRRMVRFGVFAKTSIRGFMQTNHGVRGLALTTLYQVTAGRTALTAGMSAADAGFVPANVISLLDSAPETLDGVLSPGRVVLQAGGLYKTVDGQIVEGRAIFSVQKSTGAKELALIGQSTSRIFGSTDLVTAAGVGISGRPPVGIYSMSIDHSFDITGIKGDASLYARSWDESKGFSLVQSPSSGACVSVAPPVSCVDRAEVKLNRSVDGTLRFTLAVRTVL